MVAVKTEPAALVVLGATGDLAQRKLYPALQRLMAREAIDARTRILGAGRRADVDDRGFRAMARRALPAASGRSEEHTSELQSRLHLVCRLLLEKKKKNVVVPTLHCRD